MNATEKKITKFLTKNSKYLETDIFADTTIKCTTYYSSLFVFFYKKKEQPSIIHLKWTMV